MNKQQLYIWLLLLGLFSLGMVIDVLGDKIAILETQKEILSGSIEYQHSKRIECEAYNLLYQDD